MMTPYTVPAPRGENLRGAFLFKKFLDLSETFDYSCRYIRKEKNRAPLKKRRTHMTFRRYLQAALPAVLAVFFLISCKEKEESLLIDEIETISASDPVNQTEEEK